MSGRPPAGARPRGMTGSVLPPLTLAVPMLAAAVLAGTQCLGFRLLAQAVALVATVATIVICALELALAIRHGVAVYWFGGWHPHHGVALGISFAIDPFGAGLACFCAVLTLAAQVFSWRHFESVGHAFPALLLVLMASIIGFCESGDLFNMFVFFELMTATAIALTAHRSDQRAPLQGALNFGISNAIGGFLVLFGIALLYGRTGALNLAQIGAALAGHRVDGLVVVAFALIVCGFFVKAAIIPFHFWLADAYASAPTPVCVIFAGVMSEVGLYGVARVYWTVFAGPLGPHAATLRLILVLVGAATALGGAVMCLLQQLLKRLLAFATISYMGLFLVGIAMLDVRRAGRHRDLRRRRRAGQGEPVRLRRDPAAPPRRRQLAADPRPRTRPAVHWARVRTGGTGAGGDAGIRQLSRQDPDRVRRGRASRLRVGARADHDHRVPGRRGGARRRGPRVPGLGARAGRRHSAYRTTPRISTSCPIPRRGRRRSCSARRWR